MEVSSSRNFFIDDKILSNGLIFTNLFWKEFLNFVTKYELDQHIYGEKFKFIISNMELDSQIISEKIFLPTTPPRSVASDSLYLDRYFKRTDVFISTGYRLLKKPYNFIVCPDLELKDLKINLNSIMLEIISKATFIKLNFGKLNLEDFYKFKEFKRDNLRYPYKKIIYLPYVLSKNLIFSDPETLNLLKIIREYDSTILTADRYLVFKNKNFLRITEDEALFLIFANYKYNRKFKIVNLLLNQELWFASKFFSDNVFSNKNEFYTKISPAPKLSLLRGIYDDIRYQILEKLSTSKKPDKIGFELSHSIWET